jgi:hypothetical protein
MADTLTTFDPQAAGLRVAATPITRKPRTPSAKPGPKPKYADAVWFSFTKGHALEAVVAPRSVQETIRKLKAAARYLERTHSTDDSKVEVRVQISVEPELGGEDGRTPTGKSVVKFLGHEPWALGRRVAKLATENGHAAEPAAEPGPAPERPRRTVAARRPVRTRRRK